MKKIVLILKGILMGFVSLAIPGLSASTIGIELNVYDKLIESIANIFKKFKKSMGFLLFLWLGFGIGSFVGAIIIDGLYVNYPIVIILAILGFVFGGMPHMITKMKKDAKKVSCWLSLIISLVILVVYNFFVTQGEEADLVNMKVFDYVMIVIIGIITSTTLIIPGIDFAVVLLSLGYYYPLLSVVSNLFEPSLFVHYAFILGLYLGGYLVGSFIFSKFIKILLHKFPAQTSYASFAFVIAAPVIVIDKCIINNQYFYTGEVFDYQIFLNHYRQTLVGFILFLICFIIIFIIPILSKKDVIKKQYNSILFEKSEEILKDYDTSQVEDSSDKNYNEVI